LNAETLGSGKDSGHSQQRAKIGRQVWPGIGQVRTSLNKFGQVWTSCCCFAFESGVFKRKEKEQDRRCRMGL